MSDLPSQGMYQQAHSRPHSGEYLEVLGKKAAADWGTGRHDTLTESVTETVKQAQLSPEQVKRVVEFANTAAFLTEFKKEGQGSSVVDFHGGPADASEILKDLNDGGGGSVFDRGTLDYDSPPAGTKTSSSREENALHELFGSEKTAAELPYENPNVEVIALKDKLASAEQHLQSQISGLEIMYADLADRVYHQVKQASLSGTSLGEIVQAWETVAPTPEHVKIAFTLMTPRLLREGVFYTVDAMTRSVDKTAGARIVNPEHPLMVEFGDFCATITKLAESRATRSEIQGHLRHLTEYLKHAFAGEVWRGSKALAERAAEAAGPALTEHLGPVGGLAKGVIRASPYIAAGVGLNELDKHVENSPSTPMRALRAVKHFGAQQIPGSDAYYEHLARIQSGQ